MMTIRCAGFPAGESNGVNEEAAPVERQFRQFELDCTFKKQADLGPSGCAPPSQKNFRAFQFGPFRLI